MKTCVIIPTYNESSAISGVIQDIKKYNLDVIVIDDGSTDNTAQIASDCAVTVIKNRINQGKGACLIKGFNYVISKDYDAVITLDGDGQHCPDDIPDFINAANKSNAGIFVGNRMNRTNDMPLVRTLTNKFMSWLISLVAKQEIPDTQCGYRLIKKPVLEKINLKTCKYETESEILIQASRLDFRIDAVPIKTIYRGEKSRINPFVDTLRFIKFIVKEL